jgi:hypothetical protein
MQSKVMAYVLYIKEICDFLRESATYCKMPKIRLKIRRASALGGSTPPPGTTPKPLEINP